MKPATERFSDRVDNYVRYRPSYPPALLDLLERECGLGPGAVVADVGAGTGIFSRLLLERGARVLAVEPNAAMRAAAEQLLSGSPGFASVAAPAEATGLADGSVDIVTAAQAFHWFDRERARHEFRRILKPGGWTVLIWNERVVDTTPFLREYEQLLQDYAPEYGIVDHRNIGPEQVAEFFAPAPVAFRSFPNYQRLDFDALKGRLLSSSYAPAPGHPNHEPMLEALRRSFDRHQIDGTVTLEYQTRVFYGRFDRS